MILDAEDGLAAVAQSLDRLIVQIEMCDFDLGIAQRTGIDAEAMILRSNFNLAGAVVQHRVIGAVVAELQLVRFAPESQTEDLVTETDPEDGNFANKLADVGGLLRERLGIAGPVREKNAIGLKCKHVFRARIGWHDRHTRTDLYEMAQDVPFNAIVVGNDMKGRF